MNRQETDKYRKSKIFSMLLLFLCSIAISAVSGNAGDSQNTSDVSSDSFEKGKKWNFVVFLTDDQRWDTLWAMPIVQDKLGTQGVTFSNAFVSTQACCPSRASLLSGGYYAHNTGVLTNQELNGSVKAFRDDWTLATLLQESGYRTALIGKYLNEYFQIAPYIPPGWTKFIVPTEREYYNYMVSVGSSGSQPSSGEVIGPIAEYLTDFEKDKALEFLDEHGDSPFFLVFSTTAPHGPPVPAKGDEKLFKSYLYRDRSYGEPDLTDKPKVVQRAALDFDDAEVRASLDLHVRQQLRTLQAVDRAVGAIVDKIAAKGKAEQTIIFYSSDNGKQWGEHRLRAKGRPYEESIRVPCLVVAPGVMPRTDDHMVLANLDIAATIRGLAGVTGAGTDGLSLVPLLKSPDAPWRKEILIEYFYESFEESIWSGLRIVNKRGVWKYVEHAKGGRELYDLVHDPYEEQNIADDPDYKDVLGDFAVRLKGKKGLAFPGVSPPAGVVGENYLFELRAWGGTKPYTWDIVQGQLPEGLVLGETSGSISGVPVKPETKSVSVRVRDSSVARYTGAPQSFIEKFSIAIASPSLTTVDSPNQPPRADPGKD